MTQDGVLAMSGLETLSPAGQVAGIIGIVVVCLGLMVFGYKMSRD